MHVCACEGPHMHVCSLRALAASGLRARMFLLAGLRDAISFFVRAASPHCRNLSLAVKRIPDLIKRRILTEFLFGSGGVCSGNPASRNDKGYINRC